MNNYFDYKSLAWKKIDTENNLTAAHRGLYWAIFDRWNRHYFKEFEAPKSEMMSKAGIKAENTYFLLLNDLIKWQYVEIQKGRNQHQKSIMNLTDANFAISTSATADIETARFATTDIEAAQPATAEIEVAHASATANIEVAQLATADIEVAPNMAATANIEAANQSATANSEVANKSATANIEGALYIDTDILSSYSTKLKTTKINNDNIIIINSEGEIEKSAAQPNYLGQKMKARRVEEVPTTFLDSEVGTLEGVTAHINDSIFPTADPEYYFNAIRDWRDKATGLAPLRPDWKLVINLFIRNDLSRNGKIVTKNHGKPTYRHLDRNSPEFIQAEFKEIDYNIKRFLAARNRNGKGD